MSLVLLLITLLVGCSMADPVVPPDILVFLVPGLRADATEVPGAEDAFLEAFEGRPALRFTAAHAQSVSGWVSTGSLLTGRYPSAIPLCGLVSGEHGADQPWCTELPPDLPTLASVLGLYGYRPAMFLMGPTHVPGTVKDYQAVAAVPAVAGRTDFERLGTLLEELRAGPEPVLALVVLPDLDVQSRPDLRLVMGLPREPSACEQVAQHIGHPRLDGQPGVPEAASPVEPAALPGGSPLLEPSCTLDTWNPADDGLPGPVVPTYPWGTLNRGRVMAVYAREAQRLGRGIASVLAAGGPEPLVVLTSPHGMDLGEVSGSLPAPKAFATHELLLDRTLRIPLVIMGPGIVSDRQVAQPVELVDLMPTLAGLVGAVPPAGLPGQDLLAPDFALDPAATAYAEFGDMLFLRQGPWALTLRTTAHQATALDPALTHAAAKPVDERSFHLHRVDQDPFQERERKLDQPALAEQLRVLMLATRTGPAAPPEDPETAARLLELRLQGSEGYW